MKKTFEELYGKPGSEYRKQLIKQAKEWLFDAESEPARRAMDMRVKLFKGEL